MRTGVQSRWYQQFLCTLRALETKAALLHEGDDSIVVVNVPWYTDEKKESTRRDTSP